LHQFEVTSGSSKHTEWDGKELICLFSIATLHVAAIRPQLVI